MYWRFGYINVVPYDFIEGSYSLFLFVLLIITLKRQLSGTTLTVVHPTLRIVWVIL